MIKIICYVSGGCLTGISCTEKDTETLIIDSDNGQDQDKEEADFRGDLEWHEA